MVPDLIGIDLVPMRTLARLQQEEDRRAGAAPALARGIGGAERLAEMPALGVRLQPEAGDDFVGGHVDQAGGGTVAFIDGVFEKAVNHLASLGRLWRQSWLANRKSR